MTESIPVPGDYNGDGVMERAFYHTPTNRWFVEGQPAVQIGWNGAECIPLPGDYDGDGKTDMVVYHVPTNQWFMFGVGNLGQYGWNGAESIPVPADYDGDGAAEIAFYHVPTNQWFVKGSPGENMGQYGWGWNPKFPHPGDYNGDGAAERAFYRPSENRWFIEGPRRYWLGLGRSQFHAYYQPTRRVQLVPVICCCFSNSGRLKIGLHSCPRQGVTGPAAGTSGLQPGEMESLQKSLFPSGTLPGKIFYSFFGLLPPKYHL